MYVICKRLKVKGSVDGDVVDVVDVVNVVQDV